MKKLVSLIFCTLVFGHLSAQKPIEKEIETEISEVTVFIDGAQISRKKTIALDKGVNELKFTTLSPFINSTSIQVKTQGDATVLSVSYQQNYKEMLKNQDEVETLKQQIQSIDEKINLEKTYLSIIQEELAFLQENRSIGGKNEQMNAGNLQQISAFYTKRLTELKLSEIERQKTVNILEKDKKQKQNEIKNFSNTNNFPSGEIWVKVDAKNKGNVTFDISYLVANAGWFPSYDIRAKNIKEPIELVYKANIKQNTLEDWNNVKLRFSSAEPYVSNVLPELQTYRLHYYTQPPTYKKENLQGSTIKGKVISADDGMGIPGVSVSVQGTTIGVTTDIDGNYSITIPNINSTLCYNYVGMQTKCLPITSNVMNVALELSEGDLESVVVVGYGSAKGSSRTYESRDRKVEKKPTQTVPSIQVDRQTTVDFDISIPYTIKSGEKSFSIDMKAFEIPAIYEYYSIPKINTTAFLLAKIIDWEQYSLLEGEANIFFEDTYIGKTLLGVRQFSDTLDISLGRDKKVSIQREKVKDFTTKRILGSKKEEVKNWKITVKNNKSEDIYIKIMDQVPVSISSEIEVSVMDNSNAVYDRDKGELSWELNLKPNEKKEIEIKYAVKYPKNRNLYIE